MKDGTPLRRSARATCGPPPYFQGMTTPDPLSQPPPSAFEPLVAAAKAAGGKGPAPVHLWIPAYCGDIDMRIAGTGRGSMADAHRPARAGAVSSHPCCADPGRYVPVTPVERVGITVEDAPFTAVEMRVGDFGDGHALRLPHQCRRLDGGRRGPSDAFPDAGPRTASKPYVHGAGGL